MTLIESGAPQLRLFVVSMLLFLMAHSVNCVIMSPRPHSNALYGPTKQDTDTISGTFPYYVDGDESSKGARISFNGDGSLDVLVKSQSSFSINLDQAIDEDVTIELKVFAGSNLIKFDEPNNITPGKNTSSESVLIIYKANSFGDRVVSFKTGDAAGHAEVICKVVKQPKNIHIDDSRAFLSINVCKSSELGIIIAVVGWLYFAAWSVSFYPQAILNYQRKSVVGLNFDFLTLNLLGHTCYSIYNFSLMFIRDVQQDYYQRNLYSRIPVEYNDLFFAMHAATLTLVTIIQCFIYERGEQKVSIAARCFTIVAVGLGIGLYIAYWFHGVIALDVVLYLSYVKLAVTLIKYTPQAYLNYQRKATTGWSIHNVFLDFTGGSLSLMQMFLLAYNYDDWASIFGNFTKFGLGLFSITFDIIFLIQHFILYRQVGQLEVSTESAPEPVISRSIRSMNQRLAEDEP